MANYENRLRRLEELPCDNSAPPIRHILNLIIDPDPTIGVVSAVVTWPDFRQFDRMPGETVGDLKRRVHEAMGWNEG